MIKEPILVSVIVAAAAIGAYGELAAQEATYEGARACRRCHNKEATGKQYEIWANGPHAGAFESLASEEALAAAEELGLGDPQEEAGCVECHATAYAVIDDLENAEIALEEGVSCESCHGPGSEYSSKRVKDALEAGEVTAEEIGLLRPTEETCRGCHKPEGNPFHEEFVFDDYVEKIAHPNPEKSGG